MMGLHCIVLLLGLLQSTRCSPTSMNPRKYRDGRGFCKLLGNGTILGSVGVQKMIISNDRHCIFPAGKSQKVVPIKLAHDSLKYDSVSGVTTFFRKTITHYKGRAEMDFCFCEPSELSRFNKYQLQYLSYTREIADFCNNAVHSTRTATTAEYGLDMRIPTAPGTATAYSILVQWHGRPRRNVYRDVKGNIKTFSHDMLTIVDSPTLNDAIASYNKVQSDGGTFCGGAYPPLTVQILATKLVIVARYSRLNCTDGSRCNMDKQIYPVKKILKCGRNQQIVIIHRENIDSWIDNWRHLKLSVLWNRFGEESSVDVFVDGILVTQWKGLLGNNDELGAHMKYGIYAGKTRLQDFSYEVKNAYSDVWN